MKTLEEKLIRDEGLRLKPYRDTEKILTIGVGRNLQHVGISKEEAMYLLKTDIKKVRTQAVNYFYWFEHLNKVRQNVVLNMMFNLGLTRFKKFKKTIAHIESGQYKLASQEMLRSKWARQVKSRAKRLSKEMATGKDV